LQPAWSPLKLPLIARKQPERAAAVGVQRSPATGKAHTGHHNRTPAQQYAKGEKRADSLLEK